MKNVKRLKLNETRARRARRTRAKLQGTAARPRLSVFRSTKHMTAQLIDDENGKTLAAVSDSGIKAEGKVGTAAEVGKRIAEAAKKANVEEVIFDRGRYAYHGRVKALAEAARENGLKF